MAISAVLYTRFAALDPSGNPLPGTVEPWAPGAARPAGTPDGVQFAVQFDRGFVGLDFGLRVEAVRLTF